MSSCAIQITGTTGSVVITYKLNGTENKMTGVPGQTLYISSDATDVTYTNINHLVTDAAAESSCIDIESFHVGYYIFSWETSNLLTAAIDKLHVGDEEYSIGPVNFNTKNPDELCDAILALEMLDKIIPTSYYTFRTKRGTFINRFILKISGPKDIYLGVRNSISSTLSTKLYVKGFDTLDPVPDKYHICSKFLQYVENIVEYTTTTTTSTTIAPTTTSTTTLEETTTTTTTEEIVETTTTTTTEI